MFGGILFWILRYKWTCHCCLVHVWCVERSWVLWINRVNCSDSYSPITDHVPLRQELNAVSYIASRRCWCILFLKLCFCFEYRHRWTGRYEAHLWDKSTWNQNQNKKGKQGFSLFPPHLGPNISLHPKKKEADLFSCFLKYFHPWCKFRRTSLSR